MPVSSGAEAPMSNHNMMTTQHCKKKEHAQFHFKQLCFPVKRRGGCFHASLFFFAVTIAAAAAATAVAAHLLTVVTVLCIIAASLFSDIK